MAAGSTIVSRKSQLALLAAACARRARLELRARRGSPSLRAESRFAGLRSGALLVDWDQGGGPGTFERNGTALQVRFRENGRAYVFSTASRGMASEEAEAGPALSLQVPLRIERAEHRRHPRVLLPECAEFLVGITPLRGNTRGFELRLRDFSLTGLGGRSFGEAGTLEVGAWCWVDVRFPPPARGFDLIARCVACREVEGSAECELGFSFESGEESSGRERRIARLEEFVRSRFGVQDAAADIERAEE